ncbi:MAG: FliH/SctL family protein [Phycisphaerae bacterium]
MTRVIKADVMERPGRTRTGVLNLTDIAAEARAVVLDARKEAARIVAEARGQADENLRAAARKGYAEGFARGQSDGYADGRGKAVDEQRKSYAADSSEMAQVVRKIIDELNSARKAVLEQAQAGMISFAIELAEKIVGRVAATDIGAARSNLAKVLELSHARAGVTIKVNPQQLDLLKSHCADLAAMNVPGEFALVADDAIAAGGVKLESSYGEIDATIRTQLDNVVESLFGKRQAGEAVLETANGPV